MTMWAVNRNTHHDAAATLTDVAYSRLLLDKAHWNAVLAECQSGDQAAWTSSDLPIPARQPEYRRECVAA